MAVWSKMPQCCEMFYHEPKVMDSNPSWVKLGGT